jgi:chaperonin cofactor prefoldin
MQRLLVSALALAAVAGAAMPAAAQTWVNINQRQAELDRRIDVGIRNGQLSRAEATKLKSEFNGIAALETQYRRSGGVFTQAEKNDLNQRMDRLTYRIRAQRTDNDNWMTINQRQAQLESRINAGIRAGSLTQNEAIRLRSEYRGIAGLEASYRRSGNVFTAQEKADLDRRMNVLAAKIRIERTDNQHH